MGSASATGLLAYCHRSRQSCLFLYSVCHLASKSFLLNLDASIHAVMTNTYFIQNSKGKRDRMKGSHNWGLRSTHPKSHHWCSEYTNLERVYCKIQGSPPFVRQTDSNLEPPWNILRNLTVFWGRAGGTENNKPWASRPDLSLFWGKSNILLKGHLRFLL